MGYIMIVWCSDWGNDDDVEWDWAEERNVVGGQYLQWTLAYSYNTLVVACSPLFWHRAPITKTPKLKVNSETCIAKMFDTNFNEV